MENMLKIGTRQSHAQRLVQWARDTSWCVCLAASYIQPAKPGLLVSCQWPSCSGGSVAAHPHARQVPGAVLGSFCFRSFTQMVGLVSLHLLCHPQPWLSTASPYHHPSSPPNSVSCALPTRLVPPLLSPAHSPKCFLKESRYRFVSVGVLWRKRTNRMCVCVCV